MSQPEQNRGAEITPEAGDAQAFTIDRRTLVKGGVIAGAAAVITSKKTAVFAQSGGPPPAPPVLCNPQPTNSPATTPFVDDLPIPQPAAPTLLSPFPTKAAN